MKHTIKILGIETSCDETAVAIVDNHRTILGHTVLSQVKAHAPYGGVVPEIAARNHMDALDGLIKETMAASHINNFNELDAIAVTAGPGLIGGLIVGVMYAKAIASVTSLPVIPVNHLEGHALTVRLTHDVPFPYLLLLVSGGHCLLAIAEAIGSYRVLGQTIDDALGEAFDKVAKMLHLGYPGGPKVEQWAAQGNPLRFPLPRPLLDRKNCDFSFSGLKTAVKRIVDQLPVPFVSQDIADLCASFQHTIADIISNRLQHALALYTHAYPASSHVVIAGGVAANQFLRGRLSTLLALHKKTLYAPPMALCTDNAAMIAWTGMEYFQEGRYGDNHFTPKARWPL